MHEATCSDCGNKCQVPFNPTGDKPVYCSQCFSSHGGGGAAYNRTERRGFERPRFQDRRMFDAVCHKCGKGFELPFRPTGDKPVYCDECFGKGGGSLDKSSDRPIDQYKEQFEALNAKLDRIIRVLTSIVPEKKEKKEVIIEKKETAVKKKEEALEKKEEAKKTKKNLPKKPADKRKKPKK